MKVTLDILRDGKTLRQETLTERKTVIGRGEADAPGRVRLEDETVSFDHAQVQIRGDDVLIQDLKSRNRVLVNGQFINPGVFYRLRDGDLIEICAFQLRLRIAQPRQAPPLEEVPPSLGPFRLGLLYAPAAVAARDFYSYQSLDGGRAGLALGTIEKGDEIRERTAAECGEMLRTEALETRGPAALLEKLNATVLTDLATECPISAVYGVLDPGAATFRFASAGGIVPVFFNHQKKAVLRRIPSEGRPLNADKGPLGTVDKMVKFRKGDVLLLLTEGVLQSSFLPDHQETQRLRNLVREELIESWSDKLSSFVEKLRTRIEEVEKQVGPFGLGGVGRVAAKHGPAGVATLVSEIEAAVKEHLRGQAPSRDLTAFGVECVG